ncbi:anillin [Drosophila persimilis]|uniref:anillin n=1 Tax=Drosophila persimilis TaxID=7234 RepID=UPI000F08236D|nr:anillin [Drosophila persimilis]
MATVFGASKSKFPKHVVPDVVAEKEEEEEEEEEEDDDDEEEDSAESGSTTSFSLQECINEFRARRIRRVSTQSRDCDNNHNMPSEDQPVRVRGTSADADLINQNRCNKAQERKGKPCKNGFCYCFTSDSGDCASTAPTRESHVRQPRRSRRSESTKAASASKPLVQNHLDSQRQQVGRRHSEPPNVKQTSNIPLTAISSICAVGDDAPLIQIIQELRDNCVVSEVRVNRQKLSGSGCQPRSSPVKTCKVKAYDPITYKPTAPALSNISEQDSALEEEPEMAQTEQPTSLQSARQSSRSRRSSGAGGRLLQKRLLQGLGNFKRRDCQEPPPKPPRRSCQSLDGKFSLSSLASTTPSVREAERVLDEFLRQRGVTVPSSNNNSPRKDKKSKRRSYPMAEVEKPRRSRQLPTCPSLSDIERVVESKRGSNYARNIQQASSKGKNAVADKPMKEILLGWTEPKINDMLNYENKRSTHFKTQAPMAEPQVAIGWQLPQPVVPKISLDTVDGSMCENLASNIDRKHTPIKYPRGIKSAGGQTSNKFIWGEQLRNFSPLKAANKQPTLKTKSKNFLNNSKNKILRFVSPKKSNHPENPARRPTPTPRLCTVGVQTSTSQLDLQSQSPPGSYHSPMQSTPSATTTSTRQQPDKESSGDQPYFDFERKIEAPNPPKKMPRATNRARKLNFHTEAEAPTTYRSFHKDLDQDVTITKMGYLLSNIRAKLEASDDRAVRTFRDSSRVEAIERQKESFDCIDGPHSLSATSATTQYQRDTTYVATTQYPRDTASAATSQYPRDTTFVRSTQSKRDTTFVVPTRHQRDLDCEPIYSEIEEDCLRIRGSPQYEVRTAVERQPSDAQTSSSTATGSESTAAVSDLTVPADLSILYARVQKPQKKPQPSLPPVNLTAQPVALGQCLQESLKSGSFFKFMPLPDEPSSECSRSESTSETTDSSVIRKPKPTSPPMHQSLNNINERNSPPKKNRNLSRSELSLQRSQIFLDNFCRSELVLDQDEQLNTRLEKIPNTCLRASSPRNEDAVSYDMPEGLYDDYAIEDASAGSSFATNDYGSCQIEPPPPPSENQSTPKKKSQRYTTKPPSNLSIDINDATQSPARPFGHNLSHSCPTTPQQPAKPSAQLAHNSSSLGELVQSLPSPTDSQLMSVSALARYRLLKDALRRSYRKGKDFFLAEKHRLTHSLNMSRDQSNQTDGELDSSTYYASFNLDCLLNESLTTSEQLAQAVSICRKMPELEISNEMVEAERLLLFSTLRQSSPADPGQASDAVLAARRQAQCVLIDAMQLPVRSDASQDMFFNYHYICTYEFEGRICSTQSVECQNGVALFRDCGLEFYSAGPVEAMELRCQIFMFRLRKISTLSLEPAKTVKRGTSNLCSSTSSCSGSSAGERVVSRFRLHASFCLRAIDLAPFELLASETQASDRICLRSSRSWQLPLTTHTKSTNLAPEISVTGRVEVRLPKSHYSGYLNVEDPQRKHHWNRRWCTLDGVQLSVWQHEDDLSEQPPLFSLHLQGCPQASIAAAPRELCARARSFLLREKEAALGFFFAADTQPELDEWLLHLNESLSFAKRWLVAP